MVAVLDYCSGLPAVMLYASRRLAHTDRIAGLIVAHREDDGDVRGKDIICPDEETAFQRLKDTAIAEYPDIEIIDKTKPEYYEH